MLDGMQAAVKGTREIADALLHEHARARVLTFLLEAPCYTMNDRVLIDLLDAIGICLSDERMLQVLQWLEHRELIRVDAGVVRVVKLRRTGADVAEGRVIVEGVRRPDPPK